MNLPDLVIKYLDKHASTNWDLFPGNVGNFENIIVIPALDELSNIKILLNSLSLNDRSFLKKTLIIVVVNNGVKTSNEIAAGSRKTLEFLKNEISRNRILNLSLVDASSPGSEMPSKHAGVGLARKIGMDEALKHFDYNSGSPQILFSLDADCTVSENYLESVVNSFRNNPIHAATVNFKHQLSDEKEINCAIINYEIFLRYYVLGLKYSGSHFSHLSIGSTMVCTADTYVKAGGMNKRKGGEDFYFLNEIAKFGRIDSIDDALVYPAARISERVPFGTGPRIKRFISREKNEYILYNPEIFEILKSWLSEFKKLTDINSLDKILRKSLEIEPVLFNFLNEVNFENDWKNIIRHSNSESQIEKQKLIWMDGFRTLKMVHFLRNKKYQDVEMFEVLDILFERMGISDKIIRKSEIPDIKVQMNYLDLMRKLKN
jgi:hypothetical protein